MLKKISIFLLLFSMGCSLQKRAYNRVEKDSIVTYEKWQNNCQKMSEYDDFLSLNKAVDTAFEYNKKFLASQEQQQLARGKVLESVSRFLPNISAIGAYTYLDQQPKVGRPGNEVLVGNQNNYSLTLRGQQAIFHGGAIVAGYKASTFFSYLADENINAHYQRLYFDVSKAYFDVLLAYKFLDVQMQAVESAMNHLKEVKLKFQEGLASNYDVLRAEVEVTNFDAGVIKQKNRISLTRTTLLKLLGLTCDYEFDLDNLLEYKGMGIDFNNAVETAYLNRPDLKAKNFEVDINNQMVNIARSEYFPQINAIVDQRWGRPDPHLTTLDKWGRDWNIRIALNWDIFEFGRRRGKVKQEKANLDQQKYLLKDIKENVVLEVQQALYDLRDADEFVKSQKLDLDRAKKALDLAKIGYKEGIKTEVDVTDAITAMTRSQSLYYQALYQHNLAKIALKLAMGVLKKEI